jgi:hypothetical protein
VRRLDRLGARDQWPAELVTFDPAQWPSPQECEDAACIGWRVCEHLPDLHSWFHFAAARRHWAEARGRDPFETPLPGAPGFCTDCI